MIRSAISHELRLILVLLVMSLTPSVGETCADDSTEKLIEVSPETTFLTGPLRTDGSIDYASGINARMKQGVTPENNACVLLWEAMRPLETWEVPPQYFVELERTPPASDRSHVRYLASGMPEPSSDVKRKRTDHVLRFLEGEPRPWRRSEFPEIAMVLDGDTQSLRTVHAAAQRNRFYSPIMTQGLDDVDRLPLVAAMDPMTTQLPYLVHSLRFRAMLFLGEGDPEAAWKDLRACFKLARLIGMGPSKVHAQRNYLLEGLNCAAMEVFIRETAPSAVQAKQYLEAFRSLPSRAKLSEKVDLFERCVYLDSLLVIRGNQEEAIAYLDVASGLAAAGKMANRFWGDAIDWNDTLRIGNQFYNHLVKSLESSTLSQRRQGVDSFRQELRAIAASAIGIGANKNAGNGHGPIESKSKLLAALIAENLTSDIDQLLVREDHTQQTFDRLVMSLARAVYDSNQP
jgi:hypothetical protein